MNDIVIGLVSCETTPEVLKPDILHLYILKSAGHNTLLLSIVNRSCAVLGESMFPVAEARPCNWVRVSFHCTGGVCAITTDTKISDVELEFLCSSMNSTDLICEGLGMEHTMTKSFSL